MAYSEIEKIENKLKKLSDIAEVVYDTQDITLDHYESTYTKDQAKIKAYEAIARIILEEEK